MWREEAACRGMEPSVFFPEVGHNGREARRVCAGCGVQPSCLAENLWMEFGIVGGTGETERRRLRASWSAVAF